MACSGVVETQGEVIEPQRWRVWFRDEVGGRVGGLPFLLAPNGAYSIGLNGYFDSALMTTKSPHTRTAYARDLATFLSFVSRHRMDNGADIWKVATSEDRSAYAYWRNSAPKGPHVSASTWNREVSSVNHFYEWAVWKGHVVDSPVLQRESRSSRYRPARKVTAPAEHRHGGGTKVRWLPGATYLRWRDIGIRGFVPGSGKRTRTRTQSARDAAFTDLMVRTGLRLQEQSALLTVEVPNRTADPIRAFSLPAVIAKGGSGRTVYVPDSVLAAVELYRRTGRRAAVRRGQREGLYRPGADSWIVPRGELDIAVGPGGRRISLRKLDFAHRQLLLHEGDEGWEPASLWISRTGQPLRTKSWQEVFNRASARCARTGIPIECSPHVLRHTFAVNTLAQLQRGHLKALEERDPDVIRHYQMVFGDPLNFVRLLLGHRSVETTSIYLHNLAEIELEQHVKALGDDWALPLGPVLGAQGDNA